MGALQVGLLPTDLFLETGQERVKISCKSPDIAFVFNSPQKYRQVLGNEIVPWNVACIQISLSLSLYLSLIFFLPSHSLQSSSSKVICAGPGWPISARRAVKFFTKLFHQSSKLLSKMTAFFLKQLLCLYGDSPPYTGYHYLPLSALHTET